MILTVEKDREGERLDAYLSSMTELSRTAAAKLCDEGAVTVNGKPCQKKDKLREGDTVSVEIPEPEEYDVLPEDIPLDVVFEDGSIIVVNKPSGMVVHPAPGNYSGTLVNALLHHARDSLSGIGGVMRPGIVHRIDKDTSGLLVVAKCDSAHAHLSRQLEYHGVVREYHALVKGGFREERGTVDKPIARHPVDRKRMAVALGDPSARNAVTHYEVIRSYGDVTYLKLMLETGRTHQIRVHMSSIGHPLIGDEVYGSTNTPFEKRHAPLLDGQMLHAKRLSFIHPDTEEKVEFECDLPDNFKKLLDILERRAAE